MQLFLRVSQYYILRGNVPFPRAGHIYIFCVCLFELLIYIGDWLTTNADACTERQK